MAVRLRFEFNSSSLSRDLISAFLISMKKSLFPLGCAVLFGGFLAGCQHPQASQKVGADYINTSKDKSELVTYVTPEEYDRMSPEDRQRLHATMGADVTLAQWGGKKPTEPISREDYDAAMKNARADKSP